ncbi:MAG: adenylate/guanylate cyclase domain-containing protein [Casimicrobiaceae bacterium]
MTVDHSTCAQCGTTLPANARFCPHCGVPVATVTLPSPAPGGERRQVTILFADLSGYTKLSSTLDPEEVHRLLTRYFELADAVIAQFGGTIDKYIGDAVMAVFGAPIAHGDDTLRALRAAGEIHAAMLALSREFGRPIAAHVGIASGEVVAADTGSAAHRAYTVTGDAVNLASRMDELAHAQETVIADDVYQPLAHMIDAQSLGAVPIRGLGRDLPVWKLLALRAPVAMGALIGRASELARFDELLARVTDVRRGVTVLVCADPGLGKTRLAEEFLAVAARAGHGRHAAAVLDFGAAQGRDAAHVIYCSLLGVPADASASARRATLDRAIAGGDIAADDEPFAADLLAVAPHSHARYEAMDNAARSEGKLRMLEAAVERAAAHRPVVLLVEDVHWASAWVLACLKAWSRRARHLPCVLVMTSRREGDPVTPAWPAEKLVRFDLAPLGSDAALALARSYLDANPDVARRCVERAQGNPLFLTQLLRSGADGVAIPGSIQSVVQARLDRLPPADKAALQAASVVGQRFGLDVLRHLLADPLYAEGSLIARDLVRRDGETGQLLFVHALIRDGAYASLLHSVRRALHLRAAEWYADVDATLRAEHLDRADDPRAAQAYLDAARGEAQVLRFDDALRLLRRAAKLQAPDALRHALAMHEGELYRDLGDAPGAIAAFERALLFTSDERQRCAAWIGVAAGYRVTSTLPPAFAALGLADEVARRNGFDLESARIHYLRGNLHFAIGEAAACHADHERALAFAQRAGDAEGEAQALSGLGDAHYAQGRMRSAHAAFSRCVAICESEGLTRFAIMNNAMIAIIEEWMGLQDASRARFARASGDAQHLRHRLAEAMTEETRGWMLVQRGEYAQALPHLERSLAVAREIGARRYETMDLMLLARIRIRRGELQEARSLLHAAWTISAEVGHGFAGAILQGGFALTAASAGERSAALALGEQLLRDGSLSHSHILFCRDAIEAALAAGAWREADRYADALAQYTRAEPMPWIDFQVAAGRALAAAGRGEGDRGALAACHARALELHCREETATLAAVLARM